MWWKFTLLPIHASSVHQSKPAVWSGVRRAATAQFLFNGHPVGIYLVTHPVYRACIDLIYLSPSIQPFHPHPPIQPSIFYLPSYLHVCLYCCLCMHLSLSISPSTYLSFNLSIMFFLSFFLSFLLSFCLSFIPSFFRSSHLSTYLSLPTIALLLHPAFPDTNLGSELR